MKYKEGDKLVCLENLKNFLGNTLYEKGVTYEVLCVFVDEGDIFVTLNHNLIGNEYGEIPEQFVYENFLNIKELRKLKLGNLNNV